MSASRESNLSSSGSVPWQAWLVCSLCAGAVLAIGGTRPTIQLTIAGLGGLCLCIHGYMNRRQRRQIPLPIWFPLALALWGFIQLIPLPVSLLEFFSPRAAQLHMLANPDVAYASISVDPNGTQLALVHQLLFAGVLLMSLSLGRTLRRRLVWTFAATGALCSVIGFTHLFGGFDRIYGFYEAMDRDQLFGFFGPFVNNNTLASFLVLGACAALGVASVVDSSTHRAMALGLGFLNLIGILASGSRGGHVALMLSASTFFLLAFKKAADSNVIRHRARHHALAAVTFAIGGGIAAMWLMPDWDLFWGNALSADDKVRGWFVLDSYIADYWLTGSGRGTFGLVYPNYQVHPFPGTVTHPENIVFQLISEWGLPFGLLALVGGIWAWVIGIRSQRSHPQPLRWALLAGLLGIGIQQLVDFGLESMGLSMAVAASLGVTLSSKQSKRSTSSINGQHIQMVMGCVLLVGTILFGSAIVEGSADAGAQRLQSMKLSNDQIFERAHAEAQAHPADYLIPLSAAAKLKGRDAKSVGQAIMWTNRAITLFPSGAEANILAARTLFDGGFRQQSAGEFRRAMEKRPTSKGPLIKEVVARFNDPEILAMAIPAENEARRSLGERLLNAHAVELALRTFEEILIFEPDDFIAHFYRARACLKLKKMGCAKASSKWMRANNRRALSHAIDAEVAHLNGNQAKVFAELEKGLENGGKTDAIFLRRAARLYELGGDVKASRRAYNHLWKRVSLDPQEAARSLVLRARMEANVGELPRALQTLEHADRIQPSPIHAIDAARVEERLGRKSAAMRRLEKALERWPHSSSLRKFMNTRFPARGKTHQPGKEPD